MASYDTHDSSVVDLLAALQLHPRASWTELAPLLGVDPSTLSRRWRALREDGLAWVICQPSSSSDWFYFPPYGSTAFVELVCRPGRRDDVVAELVARPEVWTVECTSGVRDLLLSVTLPNARALDQYTNRVLGTIDAVMTVRTNPVRRFLFTPSDWRIDGLDTRRKAAVTELAERAARAVPDRPPSALERTVMSSLAADGRATAQSIAAASGYSLSGVNGAIRRIMGSGWASLRVDFAQEMLGWDIMASLWIQAPQSKIPEIGALLRRFPGDVREAVALVGSTNLYVHIWTKDFETIDAIEELITGSFPGVRLADRWITTRFAKRAGVVMGTDGRRHGFVPPVSPPTPGHAS